MIETGRVTFRVTRSADVEWIGTVAAGVGHVTTPSGVLERTPVTFVTRTGEPDGHTSPEELIAAAQASCFAMSLVGALGAAEISYSGLEVRSTVTLGRVDGLLRLIGANLDVVVTGEELQSAAVRTAVSEADSRCPVSTALRATMPVTISALIRVA